MPMAVVIPAVMAAASIGSTLASSMMAPGPSDYSKAMDRQRIADAQSQERSKTAAVAAATPDAIEASGGSLTTPGFMNLASILAGVTSDPLTNSNAIGQVFGANAPGTGAEVGLGPAAEGKPAESGNPVGSLVQKLLDKFLTPGGSSGEGMLGGLSGTEFAGSYT